MHVTTCKQFISLQRSLLYFGSKQTMEQRKMQDELLLSSNEVVIIYQTDRCTSEPCWLFLHGTVPTTSPKPYCEKGVSTILTYESGTSMPSSPKGFVIERLWLSFTILQARNSAQTQTASKETWENAFLIWFTAQQEGHSTEPSSSWAHS